jgi:hypothetical protein
MLSVNYNLTPLQVFFTCKNTRANKQLVRNTNCGGNVAAKALIESSYIGNTYIITGPETLSYVDAAELLLALINKQIVYLNPTLMG